MSFLYCNPNVLVVKNNYEVIVNVLEQGVCYIKVGRKTYYANNTGIMPSVNLVQKFLIPQKQLDAHKKYTVCYERVFERKSYFPEVGKEERKAYAFKLQKVKEGLQVDGVSQACEGAGCDGDCAQKISAGLRQLAGNVADTLDAICVDLLAV